MRHPDCRSTKREDLCHFVSPCSLASALHPIVEVMSLCSHYVSCLFVAVWSLGPFFCFFAATCLHFAVFPLFSCLVLFLMQYNSNGGTGQIGLFSNQSMRLSCSLCISNRFFAPYRNALVCSAFQYAIRGVKSKSSFFCMLSLVCAANSDGHRTLMRSSSL